MTCPAQDSSAQPGTSSTGRTVKHLRQATQGLQRDNIPDSKNRKPAQLFTLIYKQDTALTYTRFHAKIT